MDKRRKNSRMTGEMQRINAEVASPDISKRNFQERIQFLSTAEHTIQLIPTKPPMPLGPSTIKGLWICRIISLLRHPIGSSTVREITKSSSTFSATNISSNIVWLLQLHDTIQMESIFCYQIQ